LAIIKPYGLLLVPRKEAHRFQLFAALTLDHIWFSGTILVHNAKYSLCLQNQLNKFLLQWFSTLQPGKDAAIRPIPMLWSPPTSGCIKANFDVVVRPDFSVAACNGLINCYSIFRVRFAELWM
jgi:hypothetical protein